MNFQIQNGKKSNVLQHKSEVLNKLTDSPASDPAISVVGPNTDVDFCGDGDWLDALIERQCCGQMHYSNVISVGWDEDEIWVLHNVILNINVHSFEDYDQSRHPCN